jgi:hypothetical protein
MVSNNKTKLGGMNDREKGKLTRIDCLKDQATGPLEVRGILDLEEAGFIARKVPVFLARWNFSVPSTPHSIFGNLCRLKRYNNIEARNNRIHG